MDEVIFSEANRILAERRVASTINQNGCTQYQLDYYKKSEADQNRIFASYCNHVETLTITVCKPSVRKVRNGAWHFEKNRMFVHPVVRVKSDVVKNEILHINAFCRFSQHAPGLPIIPNAGFNFTEELLNEDGRCVGTQTQAICSELIPLVHQIFGAKFDELNVQMQAVNDDVKSRITELVEDHKNRVGDKERKKFQEKLFKFLDKTKSFSDSDPGFLLACFRIDPNDLEVFQKFLRVNKADVNFATEEDVVEAQKMAKISEVLKS